jgi:hypothetical protein
MKNYQPILLALSIVVLIFHFRKDKLLSFYKNLSSFIWRLSLYLSSSKYFTVFSKYIGYFLIILSILILSLKAIELSSYGAKILPEIIAPLELSKKGEEVFKRFIVGDLNQGDLCHIKNICSNNHDVVNSINNQMLTNFLKEDINNTDIKDGLLQNQLIGFPSSYRGYYFHHYSTILYSYRELKAGNWLSALTNQYGLASIIPLFILEDLPFYYYALASLSILIIFFALSTLLIQEAKYIIIYGALTLLIAFTTLVEGVRISPGFSIYRFIPTLIIITLLYTNDLKKLSWIKLIFLLTCLAINSLQFNILIFLIYLISLFTLINITRNLIFERVSITIFIVILFQSIIYYYVNNDLEIPLFSSLQNTNTFKIRSISILIFPILMLFLKLVYSWKEIFTYISFILLSSYTIFSYGSAQHYSNFLILSLPMIFLMIKNAKLPLIIKYLFPIYFYFLAFNMSYISLPINSNNSKFNSNYYEYLPIGKDLKFEIPNKVEIINLELQGLLKKYNVNDYYFISKDKLYIDMYNNKNTYPQNYDIFLHLNFIKSSRLIKSMKKNKIEFLIIDSPDQQNFTASYITAVGKANSSKYENLEYLKLLTRMNEITTEFLPFLLSCSQRYCVFRLAN